MARVKRKIKHALKPEQVLALLKPLENSSIATNVRDYAAFVIMWRCGARANEISKLRMNNIDIANRTIRIVESKSDDRIIILDDFAIAKLEEWLKIRPKYASKRNPFVFCIASNRKANFNEHTKNIEKDYAMLEYDIARTYWTIKLHKLSEKTGVFFDEGSRGLKPAHAHCLRTTFCTDGLREGFNIVELQRLGGWKSLSSVQSYAHAFTDELALKVSQRKSPITTTDEQKQKEIARLQAEIDRLKGETK